METNAQYFDCLCRTCMNKVEATSHDDTTKPQQQWLSIFDTIAECGEVRIAELLSDAVPQIVVQPSDELPKKICTECLQRLLSVYRFQQICVQSARQMHELLSKEQTVLKTPMLEGAIKRETETNDAVSQPLKELPCSSTIQNLQQPSIQEPLAEVTVQTIEPEVAESSSDAHLQYNSQLLEYCNDSQGEFEEFIKNEPIEDDEANSEYSDGDTMHSTIYVTKDEPKELQDDQQVNDASSRHNCHQYNKSYKRREYLRKHLNDHKKKAKINIDCFKAMTEADIKEIFNEEIGTRIKFRGLVNEWRLANQLAPISTCCCKHSDQSSASGSISQSDSISSFSESGSSTYKFSLHNFLDSAIGIKICANYNANNELGASDREALISNIVRDHLEKDVPMNYAMFDNITGDIVKRFASEKKEYYFQKEKRNGKLYNKYRSMSRAFRKSGFFKKYLRVRTNNKLELESREVSAISVSGIDSEDKIWLKTRNSPWETVELKWNSSFALRRQDINIHPLQFILSDWPLYAHSNGYRLIDIDFHNMYPEKSNLFLNNWNSLKDNIIAVCKNIVKFPAAKKIINNLPTNKDLELIEVSKVLAAIFKPVARKTIEKQTWKVSTGDAWNSFVVEINSAADIQSTINKRKEFCESKNINFQPFLIILKDGIDINSYQYVLIVESLIYLFADAFNAFDTYFKCFFVFNLEYPFENTIFWNFVQHFFYDIPTTKINSPELDIFTQLKQK